MEKCSKGIPLLKISKQSKKAKDEGDLNKKNYMKLISGGMIGNYNYIGTILNGLIQ